jgi:diguanylate cyclase (GGDEF)-like protein
MSGDFPNKILVVEDDPTIRMMVERAFAKVAQVKVAVNGEEGLRAILESEPDFVISDLSLPVMDGLSMLKRARRTFAGAVTPILILTASDEGQVLLDCFRQGADDFMHKPFSIAELRVRVSSIYLRQMVARDMNPLTRLPGNLVIKREIERRLAERSAFAVLYIDIDNFKPFNDAHGFDAGDLGIQGLAEILRAAGAASGWAESFVGHIGGDDFVLLTAPDHVEAAAMRVHEAFSERVRRFYSDEEIRTGRTKVTNRRGEIEEVPLLSLSIGAVLPQRSGVDDYRKITEVAAEVKKLAKKIPGNSLFIDRRRASFPPPCTSVLQPTV